MTLFDDIVEFVDLARKNDDIGTSLKYVSVGGKKFNREILVQSVWFLIRLLDDSSEPYDSLVEVLEKLYPDKISKEDGWEDIYCTLYEMTDEFKEME